MPASRTKAGVLRVAHLNNFDTWAAQHKASPGSLLHTDAQMSLSEQSSAKDAEGFGKTTSGLGATMTSSQPRRCIRWSSCREDRFFRGVGMTDTDSKYHIKTKLKWGFIAYGKYRKVVVVDQSHNIGRRRLRKPAAIMAGRQMETLTSHALQLLAG